jgi:diguanylate cyclase (GGDEF)-like protein
MQENGIDSLTGLPDQDGFFQCLAESVSALRPGRASLALLMLDLDDFSSVNQRIGRNAGDGVLRTAARRIVGTLRRGDVAARFGSDEFAVICERLTSEEAVVDIAARLLDSVAQPYDDCGDPAVLTACIGIAVARSTGPTPDDLTQQAQLALGRAKKQGRLRFHIFDPDLHRRASVDPADIKPA